MQLYVGKYNKFIITYNFITLTDQISKEFIQKFGKHLNISRTKLI